MGHLLSPYFWQSTFAVGQQRRHEQFLSHTTARGILNKSYRAMQQLSSADYVMAAFKLEEVQQEMSFLDRATLVAERTLFLALLGPAAAAVPTLATLNLLAKCFDSSARLKPTLDVLPLFPFLNSLKGFERPGCHSPTTLLSSGEHRDAEKAFQLQLGAVLERNALPRPQFVVLPPMSSSSIQPQSPLATAQARIVGGWEGALQFDSVAVGGTFDRLHSGHRLLLAATALVATQRIFVGITADKLLANKKNKELLQSYEVRELCAVDYMKRVNPGVQVASGPLTDPKVPPVAATEEAFDAIVVSEETIHGAEEINHVRRSLGFKPLVIVVVGLLSGKAEGPKLSSTDLRALAAAR